MENTFIENFVQKKAKNDFLKDLVEKKIELKIKIKNNESNFRKALILRVMSKPAKDYSGIELSRKIIQMLFLVYKVKLNKSSIKSLIYTCSKKRNGINILEKTLNRINISHEQFILFSFWYLNIFPLKIYQAISWIIFSSVFAMNKYKTADPGLYKIIYDFAKNNERGQRLLRMIKVKEEEKIDHVFEILKNI